MLTMFFVIYLKSIRLILNILQAPLRMFYDVCIDRMESDICHSVSLELFRAKAQKFSDVVFTKAGKNTFTVTGIEKYREGSLDRNSSGSVTQPSSVLIFEVYL
mgnify:CR=1 FL=1